MNSKYIVHSISKIKRSHSQMVFKNKEQVSYKYEEFIEVFFFFWTKKNIKVKSNESYNPRERYQVDIVLFSKLCMGLI